jgi:hypothetical protein
MRVQQVRSRASRWLAVLLIAFGGSVALGASSAPDPLGGLGILGDSSSDEFRADDDRGGGYSATTFNWVELLVRFRGVDTGSWGQRPEPQRGGYAYNWARSGATAEEIVSGGQVDGLAAQVAAGKVSTVVIYVGANDFATWNGTYAEIYEGQLSGRALDRKLDRIVGSLRTAIARIRAAGPARIFVATLVDRSALSAFRSRFPDPRRRVLVSRAIDKIDDEVRRLATDAAVHIVDLQAYGRAMLPLIKDDGTIDIGGEPISMLEQGDEPHHLLLGDDEHAGTVASGLLANVFIDAFIAAGLHVERFAPDEILANAGIVQAGRARRPP